MGASAELREAEWIERIAGGDRAAFERLYRAYQQRIAAFIFRVTRDAESAAEATNDVMVTVWKEAKAFQGRSKPSTWIFGIARYKALRALRALGAGRLDDLDRAPETEDSRPDPEQTLARDETLQRVTAALDTLPAEQREALHLAFFQGMSYDEIAEIAGCPVATVKTRVFHAKKKLQPVLRRMGLEAAA